jgi:hypothetical protein
VLRPRLFQHGLLTRLFIERATPFFVAAAARKSYASLLGGFNRRASRLRFRLQIAAIEQRQRLARHDLLPFAHADFP